MELTKVLRVNKDTIWNWEKGRRWPEKGILERIEECFGEFLEPPA
ncbi:MAG TPA: hypothetical protein DDZ83_07020 [Nitrospinae bacterium]|nr:hypothetical protein [Nitrospinota bacterium]